MNDGLARKEIALCVEFSPSPNLPRLLWSEHVTNALTTGSILIESINQFCGSQHLIPSSNRPTHQLTTKYHLVCAQPSTPFSIAYANVSPRWTI